MVAAGVVVRRDVDWTYAAFVAFSCFVHFAVATWARTADWPIDDAIVPDVYAGAIFHEVPVLALAATGVAEAGPTAPANEPAPVAERPRPAGRTPQAAPLLEERVRAAGILKILTSFGGGEGVAADVLRGGSVSGDLDDVLGQIDGVATAMRPGLGLPRPVGGGSEGTIAGIGRVETESDRDVAVAAREEEPLRIRMRTSPPIPTGGTGCLPEDDVARIVRQRLPAIRMCYERALRQDRTLGGRLVVDFTVGGAGTVTDARVAQDGLRDPAVGACLVSTFRRFRFPAPTGGAVRFSFPFLFEPAK